MTITEITFTAADDQKIWEVLNDYRQFRLTTNEGIYQIKKLMVDSINEEQEVKP